jgi:tetratricopeptide (TPR) repeat protein
VTYKRDISSIIKFVALALVLFIGYHAWLKPAYLTQEPVSRQFSEAPPPQRSPGSSVLRTDNYPSWDIPQSRLIDLGEAPTGELGIIRDEVEKGNFREAERRLMAHSNKRVGNAQARRYLAALWNNLGVQQEKFGGSAISVKAFKKSVALDPANPLAYLNLTQAYWELRDPAMTIQFLNRAIQLNPTDPFSHLALAELLLEKGDKALAITHLDIADTQTHYDPHLQSYRNRLLANADVGNSLQPQAVTVAALAPSSKSVADDRGPILKPRQSLALSPSTPSAGSPISAVTPQVNPSRKPLAPLDSPHFSVQFDGPEDQETWMRIRAMLEYAYEEIPPKFGQMPTRPVKVVLHTGQKFSGPAGIPHWADTLFDHKSGSIHLPTQGALDDLALFSRVVRHQFAHALFHEQAKPDVPSTPTWLMEGLAIHLTEDPWPDIEESRQHNPPLMPLPSLHGSWARLPSTSLPSAYLTATAATRHLVDRHSMYTIRQLMNALMAGQPLETAMQQTLSLSYEQFQRQWAQSQKPHENERES